MAKLETLATAPVKMILLGDSGSGKTGSLVSLVAAGYKLRIYDFDNGLDALFINIKQQCPDKIGNVEFMSFRDKFRATPAGPMIDGQPKAYTGFVGALKTWDDGSEISSWDTNTVIVVDSLTFLGNAVYNWAESANPGARDNRQTFYNAQQRLERLVQMLTDPNFMVNVIVIAHITYNETDTGAQKGQPATIGSKLSNRVAAYFNTVVMMQTEGHGKAATRVLKTTSTPLIDLKNPAYTRVKSDLPINTGLADIFKAIREA